MGAGAIAGWIGLGVLALGGVLFAVGLRRALAATWLAWRARCRVLPMTLRVTARSEHGAYFQLRLQRRWWARAAPLPTFDAGMYLTLLGPRRHDGRPDERASRRYSLAAWRRRPWAYELAIKREPGGQVSNWAGERLHVGAAATVLRPAGSFVLPAEMNGEIVLIGAGIGITPLRAMVQAWVARRGRAPLTLVWSVRQRSELMGYGAEFESLARRRPGLRYVPVLTGDDPAWRGERGRVDAARVRGWCQSAEPLGFWMCASAPMMDGLRAGLGALGVSPDAIHHEAFGAVANEDQQRYRVSMQPSGRELGFCGQPSLLALLQQEGEPVTSDCRNGSCGSCRVFLREGRVREVIAPEQPLPRGEVLACCAVPESDLVLALPVP
jgi:ferredoxin-NADP reductase